MVHLAKNSNLVEDLSCAFGATELGALDGGDGAVIEDGFEDLAEATGA